MSDPIEDDEKLTYPEELMSPFDLKSRGMEISHGLEIKLNYKLGAIQEKLMRYHFQGMEAVDQVRANLILNGQYRGWKA